MLSSRRSRAFHVLRLLAGAFGFALCACSRRLQSTPAVQRVAERCDDHGWCTQTPPGLGTTADTLTGVWARDSNDVWAVGLSGALWHWDGARWLSRGHPVEVRLDEAARRLVLSGGGCDGYLPLDGSMRFVAQ